MRLLFDEQLAEDLCQLLRVGFPDSLHIRLLGRGGASDEEISTRYAMFAAQSGKHLPRRLRAARLHVREAALDPFDPTGVAS